MVGGRCLAITTILLLALSAVAQAECIAVPVSEDESVLSDVEGGDGKSDIGYPTRNQHYQYDTGAGEYTSDLKKGLWTGVFQNPSGVPSDNGTTYLRSRFYLKFDLSELDSYIGPGEYIASAVLKGYYCNDHNPTVDKPHNFYYVEDDAWSEAPDEVPPADQPDLDDDPINGITWNNQPVPDFENEAPLGVFNPGSYGLQAWDITSTVVAQHSGDKQLSLMFKAADESFSDGTGDPPSDDNRSGEFFMEQEENGCCQFVICVDVVPSPSVFVGLLSMGAAGGLVLGYRRWRHRPAK